jgi:hypothetical protein
MRRIFVLGVLAVATLVLAAAAHADHGDARPACVDLRNADYFYNEGGFVVVNIDTEQPTCRWATYTLHVLVDENETVSTSVSGTGASTSLQITSDTFADADGVVCAFVTTSVGGADGTKHVFDEVGGDGTACAEMIPGGIGGTGFH